MRPLVSLLGVLLLGLGASACGAAGKGTHPAPARSSALVSTGTASVRSIDFRMAHGVGGLKGDGEDDENESRTEGLEPRGDGDNDTDNDVADNAGKGYYDGDDGAVSAFGHAAGAQDERALLSTAKRYYEAAAGEDGATVCSLFAPGLARTIPEDYGGASGPAYLRGAKSCPALMSLMLAHEHAQFTAALEVTGVRVSAGQAYVLLGSRTAPASFLTLRRAGHGWGLVGISGAPLP